MGLVFLFILGLILGWVSAIVLRPRGRDGVLVYMVAGMMGALIGGILVNPLVGNTNLLDGHYSAQALLVGLGGAIIVLFSVHLLRDRELR